MAWDKLSDAPEIIICADNVIRNDLSFSIVHTSGLTQQKELDRDCRSAL